LGGLTVSGGILEFGGDLDMKGFDIDDVGTITADTLTDGTLVITGGTITDATSITTGTLSDGTLNIQGGNITSANCRNLLRSFSFRNS